MNLQNSLLMFFHLCLVSILFSGPSLLEMKFCRNFFLSDYKYSIVIYKTLNERKNISMVPELETNIENTQRNQQDPENFRVLVPFWNESQGG